MRKTTPESVKELEKVLISFNTNKKLEFSISEMLIKKVAYGQNLKKYLISKGFCDADGVKISQHPVLINDMNAICNDIAKFMKSKIKSKNVIKESVRLLEVWTDTELVEELRNRGIEVSARKVITVDL